MPPRVRGLFAAALFAGALAAQSEAAPGPDTTGKVMQWKSNDGLVYHYFVPKNYDPQTGANLTFILHGSNLDHRWGFANHEAGKFRADDIVVCPDGTTSNGNGGFNFLQGKKDLDRLAGLHAELREALKIRATFLYGHSQGSFFSFLYAGAHPEHVQGVVGQASGVWIGTAAQKQNHHQAIVLMHGTADPVVPYGQSVGGLALYRDADYPLARLRSLEGWNHWPTQHHTEQQLAWCEGMTTGDPQRLAVAFETLNDVGKALDPVALYQVAKRAAEHGELPANLRKQAADAAAEVDEVAQAHVAAITKALGRGKASKLADKPWVGHLPMFLRDFEGIPACDELRRHWSKTLAKHETAGKKHSKLFWRNHQSKPVAAFAAGVDLVDAAFLRSSTADADVLDKLDEWAKLGKKAGIGRKQLKNYKKVVPVFRSALAKGRKAYAKVSKRF